jgi:hypothetical protein
VTARPWGPSTVAAAVLSPGASRTVAVPARPRWSRTRILLEEGVAYLVSTDGEWLDWRKPSKAAGYRSPSWLFRLVERFRRHPTARWFALVGTVDRRRATQFVLGGVPSFVAPASGELVCYANDLSMMRWNNSGEVRLTVLRPDDGSGAPPSQP